MARATTKLGRASKACSRKCRKGGRKGCFKKCMKTALKKKKYHRAKPKKGSRRKK